MPEQWRRSVLLQTFNNKGNVQNCVYNKGIKSMSHTMKLWVEAGARGETKISEEQFGFMQRTSTTYAMLALRVLMEKMVRRSCTVFVGLKKA